MGIKGTGNGDQPPEVPTAALLLQTAHGIEAQPLSPCWLLSFDVCIEGQPGVIPLQPTLFKQNDAKSVPESQLSASGLSSLHLDAITEPAGEWEKAIGSSSAAAAVYLPGILPTEERRSASHPLGADTPGTMRGAGDAPAGGGVDVLSRAAKGP